MGGIQCRDFVQRVQLQLERKVAEAEVGSDLEKLAQVWVVLVARMKVEVGSTLEKLGRAYRTMVSAAHEKAGVDSIPATVFQMFQKKPASGGQTMDLARALRS